MKTPNPVLFSFLLLAPGALMAQTLQQKSTSSKEEAIERNIERAVAAEAEADSLATYDMLDDLVIEAVRPMVTSDGATTTYSVEEDPAAKGQSLLDVLRRVPGVTVDGQDNIMVQGKSDFKIYVNGREEPMLSQNAKEIFKAMPASSVGRIEVITDPGAKFDAEGTAGILNLVTERKQRENGYSGNLFAGASTGDYNAGGFFTGRIGKVTASVNYTYAGNDGLERVQTTENTSDYLATGESLAERQKIKTRFGYMQGGYKLSWEPNDGNLFTTSFNFSMMSANIDKARQSSALFGRSGNLIWQSGRLVDATVGRDSYSADASYQHNFDNSGHLIVASYGFTFGDNDLRLGHDYDMQEGTAAPWRQRTHNVTLSRQHTAQVDYTNPFGTDKHKLEAGVKGIFRRNSAFGNEKSGATLDSPLLTNPEMDTDIMQFQDVLAAYASYNFTSERWNARAGVRYENTRMGIHFHDNRMDNFQTRLNDVVPNASVTYSFGPATNLRLAYSMRISRPTIEQVNPFEQEMGYRIQAGNPDLSSERLNKVSLTYTAFGRVIGGSIGVDYSHTANSIESVMSLDGLYTYYCYDNTGDKQTVGFHGFLNWNIIRNMTLSVNGDVEYRDFSAPSLGYYARGWNANLSGNWSWRLENVADFGIYGGWGSPSVNLQGRYYSWHYYGISIGRSFLKDKSLNISINASDFGDPIHTFKWTTHSDGLKVSGKSHNNNWKVGLSVSWSFGSLNENVKTTAADLDIDDRSAGGSGQQGGGVGI